MGNSGSELTSRYYAAEKIAWILSALLLIWLFLGFNEILAIPYLEVILKDPKYYPHVMVVFLLVVSVYLLLEWNISPKVVRNEPSSKFRLAATFLLIVVVLWLFVPVVTADTFLSEVPPAWYLAFAGLGYLIGIAMDTLIFATLMIRTTERAERIGLKRVPHSTTAQYMVWIPIIIILLTLNKVLHSLAPAPLSSIAFYITAAFFLLSVFSGLASLLLGKGKEDIREIIDSHDYSYVLDRFGKNYVKKYGKSSEIPAKELQNSIRTSNESDYEESIGGSSKEELEAEGEPDIHVKTLSDITRIEFPKDDGGESDESYVDRRVILQVKSKNKGFIDVTYIPHASNIEEHEMSLPIEAVQNHAQEYLNAHKAHLEAAELLSAPDEPSEEMNLLIRKVLSHALNQATIDILMDKMKHSLLQAVYTGQREIVAELIKMGANANEVAYAGWTPLLVAAAEGHVDILTDLLNAGANPDIRNLNGSTPITFGARYDNIGITRVLIEHGADINIRDHLGDTALIVAASFGCTGVINYLIREGANVKIKNALGLTALNVAQERGHGKSAKLLRLAGKKRRKWRRPQKG